MVLPIPSERLWDSACATVAHQRITTSNEEPWSVKMFRAVAPIDPRVKSDGKIVAI